MPSVQVQADAHGAARLYGQQGGGAAPCALALTAFAHEALTQELRDEVADGLRGEAGAPGDVGPSQRSM